MKTTRTFRSTERYEFDANQCSGGNGYAQVDTEQDASYFGTWANPFERKIISYTEGDICIQEAESDEEFVQELNTIQAWNVNQGYKPIKIDCLCIERLEAEFDSLGLGDFLY